MPITNSQLPTSREFCRVDPSDPPPASPALRPRLLDALREQIRYRHYSQRTEEAYVHWVRAFIHFHDRRHPGTTGCDCAQAR